MKKKVIVIKTLFSLIGIVLISLAIWFPIRKMIYNDKEIIEVINLSSFKGEIVSIDSSGYNPFYWTISGEKIENLNEYSENSILRYDTINNRISIIIPDISICGKCKIITNYIGGHDEYKSYSSKKVDKRIIVYSEQGAYMILLRLFYFCILFFPGLILLIFARFGI